MSNSGQLRTLALNENRIRSDSDPTAGRMKSISRAGSIDTAGARKKTQRQSSITQFIYKDPKLNLGNACSTPEKHTKSNQKVDKEIQVSNNLEDNLCEDEPNEEYWKELAKEREKALNDTLEENRSLCELIQVRTAEYDEIQETLEEIAKENTLLKEKAKQADVLTEVLQELVGETE